MSSLQEDGFPRRSSAITVLGEDGDGPPEPELRRPAGQRIGHDVRFYEEGEFPANDIAAHLAERLIWGGGVVVVARDSHWALLHDALALRGIAVAGALERGQLVSLDAETTLAQIHTGGALDEGKFAALVGSVVQVGLERFGSLDVFGELADLLGRRDRTRDALRLEAWCNRLRRELPFGILCAYGMDSFGDARASRSFDRVCAAHGEVHAAGSARLRDLDPGRLLAHFEQRTRALRAELRRTRRLERERRTSYEHAEEARIRAEEASRARDELLATLGHELRNPLAPMVSALELMRMRAGDVALRERAVLERQLQHMTRLVDDLLDIGRLTRGEVELVRRPVELSEVVARAVELAGAHLGKGHQLSIEVPAADLLVDADPPRLAQAVANLLVNAAKFTPGGGLIEVRAEAAGDRARLQVCDQGAGIAPALLPRVFDAFTQGPQTLDRAAGGLGVGLAIVRKVVELHGGAAAAESAGPGTGSTFTIEVPLSQRVSLSPPVSGTYFGKAARAARRPEGAVPLRILVVDDNADAAETLAEYLAAQGHATQVAADGAAALEMVKEGAPDLALLDIGLPGMDGFELARRLRAALGAEAPTLVAVTGYGQPSDVRRAQVAGFDDHLVKPVDFKRLGAIIDDIACVKADARRAGGS